LQREDIIRAAAQIFREKGYQAASMQDIADSVSLQKASLYHHIRSKQEILVVILDQALDGLVIDMQQIVDSDLAAGGKLRQAIHTYLQNLTRDVDLAAVLLLEHRNLDQELKVRHIKKRDQFEGLWRQVIQEGVESGEFHAVDVSITTFAILGVLNWTITWYQDTGRCSPDHLASSFTELFLSGLIAEGGG
jgi:AcrR family transcriptional regulator